MKLWVPRSRHADWGISGRDFALYRRVSARACYQTVIVAEAVLEGSPCTR